jgi:hypothetical protein
MVCCMDTSRVFFYFAGSRISHGPVEVRMCLPQFSHPLFVYSETTAHLWDQGPLLQPGEAMALAEWIYRDMRMRNVYQ